MCTGVRSTSPGVRQRPATVHDVVSLAELDAVCFGAKRWPVEAWEEVVTHPSFFTLVVETPAGELAAAAVLLRQESLISLASLAVAPSWRGQGVGASLLDQCLRLARVFGGQLVALEVDENNDVAVNLYQRFGFRVQRGFVEDGVARLEMVLALPPPA